MTDTGMIDSVARAHFPYRAEYCKTSRARCKKCEDFMEADSLKLASLTKSRFHDGYDASYYHVECFFQVRRPNSVAEIRHFETLKYEDQNMLELAIETKGLSISGNAEENGPISGGRGNSKRGLADVNHDDFLVEYAKSNRSTCNLCDQKIDKAIVRLGKLDFEAETAWNVGPVPRWFHVECFVKSMDQLEFYGQVEKIKNFSNLDDEDQKMLKKKVKVIKSSSSAAKRGKKAKTEDYDDGDRNENLYKSDTKEEKLLKKQSDRFFALRDYVDSMKKKDVEELLFSMNQKHKYKATSILTDMATDILLFGPLNECPKCGKEGGMQLRGSSYICTLSDEWTPCTYESRNPPRSAPNVPNDIAEKYDFFTDGTYKFKGGQRLFSSKLIEAMKQREAEENNIVQDGAPLEGLTLGLTSWKALKNEKGKVQKQITTLGGKMITVLDRTLFVILSNKNELEKDSPKVEVAKDLNVPIATDDFLFKIKTKDDVVPQLSKSIINGWDGDLKERFIKMNVNKLKQNIKNRAASSVAKSVYKSSRAPKSQTLIVKDGTAVDPNSNLAEVGRVYKRGAKIYSVVLNCIDVLQDKNSFYTIQIIEHDTRKEYYLYRGWGRIGCEVGGTSCRGMESLDEAIETFEQLFEEKTGNSFSTLADGSFKKLHGRYFPIEVDYSDTYSKENEIKLEYSMNSTLEKPVQELICFIFDIQRMHMAMKQFDLDSEKMPLGKLSRKHIIAAMDTLKELQQALEVKPPKKASKKKLVMLTNKFFSYIPQSFGDGQVELISTLDQVEAKSQILAGLQEIEIAYKMCCTITKTGNQLPVDQYYTQLGCSILALDHNDKMFKLILNYVKTTHAVTHNNFRLNVEEIFQIDRESDMKKFSKHKEKSRALLWHGSRTTNFAGILSQGLRVAPPEAPTTGFMFGKGIYFADMCSKAANYCMTDPSNNTGLLLLCEVALGKTHELLESDTTLPETLPKGFSSVKGVGKNTTEPKTHVIIDDEISVPIGKQVTNKGVQSQLLYNEYVIYDESQTQLRYIIKAKFLFR